jgi:hypothetical protein
VRPAALSFSPGLSLEGDIKDPNVVAAFEAIDIRLRMAETADI